MTCRHPLRERAFGGYRGYTIQRYPLAYGSAEVDICEVCGSWTLPKHNPGQWWPGPYELARRIAVAEREDW